VGAAIPAELTVQKRVISKKKHAAQFAIERLHPTEEGGSELSAIHRDYRDWCATTGLESLPAAQIGLLLAELFDGAGLSIAEREGKLMAVGVSLKEEGGALVHRAFGLADPVSQCERLPAWR
jgi:hypothetical protein